LFHIINIMDLQDFINLLLESPNGKKFLVDYKFYNANRGVQVKTAENKYYNIFIVQIDEKDSIENRARRYGIRRKI